MDGVGEWRLVDSGQDEPGRTPQQAVSKAHQDGRGTLLLATLTIGLVTVAAGLAIWATLPGGGVSSTLAEGPAELLPQSAAQLALVADPSPSSLVVDVEGAVVAPGVHVLPGDARLGEAIAAAGGYSPQVDVGAASRSLNLAARVSDGAQIWVPILGDRDPVGAASGAPAPVAAAGQIDVNHASAEELDTLPGIGSVTAAKIIDARGQELFSSIDDLQSRGVVGTATYEKIRELVTALP